MPATDLPDYYKILGAPVDADAAEIRRAFRRRVREVHPDVAVDKVGANEAFLRLKDAYAVLSDPSQRTNYDLQRSNLRSRVREASSTRPGPGAYRSPNGPRPTAPGGTGAAAAGGARWDPNRKLTAAELMERAMRDMLAGKYQSARADLSEALAYEPYNPDALVMMGRLYESIGRQKEWIRVLDEGLRKNPGQTALRLALNEARKAETRHRDIATWTDDQREQRRSAYRAFGITTAALAFGWGMLWKEPGVISLLGLGGAPWQLLAGGVLCAAMSGWTMAASGYIEPLDDELFFSDLHARPVKGRYSSDERGPMGLAVPFLALINYFVAVVVMAGLMWSRGALSRSLLIVSGASLGLAFAMVVVAHSYRSGIVFWCPGWLLCAMFVGWVVGDIFRI
jgi:curved DNA-binding protein CbpA